MSGTNENRRDDLSLPVTLRKFYVGVVLGSGLMVAAYVVNFSAKSFQFSSHPGDWGVFGDYIGGTLGTVFGFAAFIGVLVTIATQREQLEQARKQAYFDELQRFLSNTAERLDKLLDRQIEAGQVLLLQRFAKVNRRVTLLSLVASVGNVSAGMLHEKDIDKDAFRAAIEDIKTELPLLATDLEYLAICMRTYQQRGGDSDIIRLYRLRYNHLVGWLYIAGLTRNETIISQFPVREFVEQLERLRTAPSSAEGSEPRI